MPAFIILYLLVPAKARNAVIFIGSLVFYSLGEPVYVFLMLLSIFASYMAARGIERFRDRRRTCGVILSVCASFNLGLLLYFKYGAFFVSVFCQLAGRTSTYTNPALPLGISFYTFQILSYVVDVYRGDTPAERNFIDLGAYISMFPQLIAGPIVIYSDIKDKLKDAAGRVSLQGISDGAAVFTIGLASKVLLANRFGQVWDTLAQMGYSGASSASAWTGAIAYTFQIYFDFNGYSLMAIGLGRMLGFELPENFRLPYTAGSVTSFWRRWHMTLTSFFRKYIYIPLGGNRKGRGRTYLNMLIVWCITGFWHGADWSFILWGFYYFVFLALERLLFGKNEGILNAKVEAVKGKLLGGPKYRAVRLVKRILSHFYTMVVVTTGWVIFAAGSLSEVGTYIGRMFSLLIGRGAGLPIASFGPVMYLWLILGALFSTGLPARLYRRIEGRTSGSLLLLVLFWWSVIQLSDGVYNPFLYFRF